MTVVNAPLAVMAYLEGLTALTTLFGTRIYGETDVPVKGYVPSDGPALCFKFRGGAYEADDSLVVPSVQIAIYAATEPAARSAWRTVHTAIQNGRGGTVRWVRGQGLPETLLQPDTGWPFVLMFYTMRIAEA